MQLPNGHPLCKGKYTIRRQLGQGGFGITYLATTADGGEVAIKEFFMGDACVRDALTLAVSVPSAGSKAEVERYRLKFIKEANNLMRLHHPNIVQVYEVFDENDTSYYVMQYMPGGSLRDNVMRYGPMDEHTALNYIRQVASALQYMHSQHHICHYDVKPGNILMDNQGKALLIDFGLSKNYDGSGQQTSSTPVGISAGYAPLEQYQQSLQEFSPATDVYALGATLYFLLSGKNPPEASVVLERGVMPPAQMSPHTWDAIRMAMVPSRQQRLQTVDDFCMVLHYGAPQMGGGTPQKKSGKGWVWAIVALIAVLAVAGIVMVSNGGGDSYSDPDIGNGPVADTTDVEKVDEPEPEQLFATKYVSRTGKSGKASSKVIIDYPVQGPQALVDAVRSYIIGQLAGEIENIGTYSGDRSDGEVIAGYYADKYVDYFYQDEDLKEYDAEMNVEIKKIAETDLFVTYETSDYVYSGGAVHGMESTEGATFRKSDGQRITAIFKDTYDDEFKQMIINEVTTKHNLSLDDIATFNEDFKYSPMPKTAPYLSRDGVELRYMPYEIASYSEGILDVTLYWWQVKDYLTTDARALCPQELE